MSESLRNDGRIWTPKRLEDAERLRLNTLLPTEILEKDKNYFLEEQYPAFGNLVPRDVATRACKRQCDAGYGVNKLGKAVFLDFSDSIQRYGKEQIVDKYGNLFQMYQKITTINPLSQPMMIYPAPHYTMGGLWVDYNLMTTVPGLYAIGEANFSDHGANRLGASALMQGLVDGYFILPYTIGDYLSDKIKVPFTDVSHQAFDQAEAAINNRINAYFSGNRTFSADFFHQALGRIMWKKVGMDRTEAGLKFALNKIERLKKEFLKDVYVPGSRYDFNYELEKTLRAADFIDLGQLMALDALNRNESCGSHFRREMQTQDNECLRDDKNFMYVAAWEYTGIDNPPILHKENLVYEFVNIIERNYF